MCRQLAERHAQWAWLRRVKILTNVGSLQSDDYFSSGLIYFLPKLLYKFNYKKFKVVLCFVPTKAICPA